MKRSLTTVLATLLMVLLVAASAPFVSWLAGPQSAGAVAGVQPESRRALAVPADLAQSVRAGDLVLMMTLAPGRAGDNELTLMYFDAKNGDATTEDMLIRLVYLDYGDLTVAWPPSEAHPGHVRLAGRMFPHEGNWRIELEIRRSGLGVTQASFDVAIRP